MLDIETKHGCFAHFKDVYLFMLEEKLEEIEITNVSYFFDKIYGNGVFTLKQIAEIIEK